MTPMQREEMATLLQTVARAGLAGPCVTLETALAAVEAILGPTEEQRRVWRLVRQSEIPHLTEAADWAERAGLHEEGV